MCSALVTGARGYLGAALAARIPASIAWQGELRTAEPFADIDPSAVRSIWHCAAVTRFGVDAASAEAINVAGSRRVFEFARRCPRLERLVLLSTLYVSGLEPGSMPARPLAEPAAFANEYERSKWRAEQILVEEFGELPWQIQRIATLIADDAGGRIGQRNVVHNTLGLLRHGLLPLIPGEPAVPVYLLDAASALDAMLAASAVQRVYHVCPDAGAAPTLGELIALAWQRNGTARGLLAPPFCTFEVFRALAQGTPPAGVLGQALASVLPFAPQLAVAKQIESSLDECPDTRALFRRVLEQM